MTFRLGNPAFRAVESSTYPVLPYIHPFGLTVATMADLPKRVVIASIIVAGVVAVASVLDLVMGLPFGGKHTMVMDILFLICAGIVGYLGWDAYKDLT